MPVGWLGWAASGACSSGAAAEACVQQGGGAACSLPLQHEVREGAAVVRRAGDNTAPTEKMGGELCGWLRLEILEGNDVIWRAQVGRWFNFKDRRASFTVECRAGLITFLMVRPAAARAPELWSSSAGAALCCTAAGAAAERIIL